MGLKHPPGLQGSGLTVVGGEPARTAALKGRLLPCVHVPHLRTKYSCGILVYCQFMSVRTVSPAVSH